MRQKRTNNKKISERKTSGIARARRKRKRIIFSVLAAIVLLILGLITYFSLKHIVNRVADDVAYDGIYLEELDVSGMSQDDIENLLKKHVKEISAEEIEVKAEEAKVKVTFGELGFGIESIEDTARQAVMYAKKGTVWDRFLKMRNAGKAHKVLDIPYTLEDDTAKAALEEKREEFEALPKDAVITRSEGKFVIEEEKNGWTLEISPTVNVIKEYLNGTSWDKKSAQAEAVVTIEEPKVTREQLSVIENCLGTYKTKCGSEGGRIKNIETGSALLNSTILLPGEEFSASAAMGPYTEKQGYIAADSYENGKAVQALGGGINQVATTLYNAVLFAELEVTERQAHPMLVDYVEPSMDAVIAGDKKDLKFKNNTEYPIYIECYIAKEELTVNIYGKETRPENRTIKFESEITGTEEVTEKYEEDAGKWIGTIRRVSEGTAGKSAKLWKVIYVDDKETTREEVNSSKYAMANAITIVGTDARTEQASARVRNSIASQNLDTIQAAIKSAREIDDRDRQKKSEEKTPEGE